MKIDSNGKVFKSDEYLKDRTILESKELELHSDSEIYIICRGSVLFPTGCGL